MRKESFEQVLQRMQADNLPAPNHRSVKLVQFDNAAR
jgi:hypothetical protein